MTEPTDDDLATYLAAKLVDACVPVVERWQDVKHGRRPAFLADDAEMTRLEGALCDLLRVYPGNAEDAP